MSSHFQKINNVASLQTLIERWHAADEIVSFVPTMGNLHDGHLKLVDIAKANSDRCVVSIFVNPTQFGPDEDFEQYPRSEQKDCELLIARGVDAVFLPDVELIYGDDVSSKIQVPERLTNKLCGKNRPGHFDGVATVVAKLFDIVNPDVAVFGNKDYQQVQVIRWLVSHLNLQVKLIAAPIVRETDGLAMSSRNQYLTETDRLKASRLHHVLESIAAHLRAGRRDYAELCAEATRTLNKTGWEVDYVEILRTNLTEPTETTRDFIILAAAHLGIPRLIDNLEWSISN